MKSLSGVLSVRPDPLPVIVIGPMSWIGGIELISICVMQNETGSWIGSPALKNRSY